MAEIHRSIEILTPIAEITSDAAHIVKLDENLVREVTEGDSDPKFPVVWVDEGKSSNGIFYDADILMQVAEQVNRNQPVGYLGHMHREGKELDNLLPDPQTVWLGATVVESPDLPGKKRIYIKGYNLPGAKVRDWLKRKAVNSVSWTGDGVVTPVREGGYKVKELVLESIDWSRKNRQGMRSGVLVAEMEGGSEVTAEEIAKLQLAELEAHNPGLIKSIKEQATSEATQEKDTAVAQAVQAKEAELTQAHENAIKENADISMMQRIREFFGIPEDTPVIDVLTKLDEEFVKLQQKLTVDWFKNEILDKKIPNEKARGLIARLIPVAEMQGDWRSEKGVDKIKEDLEARVDDALENDEDVKVLIQEMGSTRGGPRLAGHSGGNRQNENNNDNKNDNDEYKNSDNLESVSVAI